MMWMDDVQQLKALAIDRDSFCFGSRIIVTTRDISSLNLLKVDEIYAVEKLNEDESLELFRWLCFKEDHPTEDHLDLSNQVVHYAGGLPLALEVLGSFFCGKSIPQWKRAIAKLRKFPDDDVQGKLEISFDSLSKEVKELFKYDVFLSFGGVDTHTNFTSHLLAALEQHGFHTFIDDKKFKGGEYIDYELLNVIEESRISLVVLSKNYAASRWCLDELVKIMECRKTLQQIVLPIFYNIEPSDVRVQKGSLAEAFAKHAEHFNEGPSGKVEKWKEALAQVANLSGWDVPKVANGNEENLILKIVEEFGNRKLLTNLLDFSTNFLSEELKKNFRRFPQAFGC